MILLSTSVVVKTFFRSRDRDLGLQVSRPIPIPIPIQFQLVTEHSLKGATNYRNRATGVGTKYAVLRPRPRPGSSGLESKTETWAFRSRDRDLDKMNSSALESRDHGLEITTLLSTKLIYWPCVAE